MFDHKKWQLFFENAGLPSTVAREYSELFVQNRITKDILSDLDRDILREMGISVIGDSMLILKQCKIAKEKGFENTIQSPVTSTTSSNSIKIENLPKGCEVTIPVSRRVTPDIEGGYTVKLPQGTTPKTRQILQKCGILPPKADTIVQTQSVNRKRVVTVDLDEEEDDDGICVTTSRSKKTRSESSNSTVFTRLGFDYQPSSTSTIKRPNSPEKIQVLKRLVNHALGSPEKKELNPVLKNRLGIKTRDASPLEYRGVLKNRLSDPTPTNVTVSKQSTVSNTGGIFARHVEKHVKHRLG